MWAILVAGLGGRELFFCVWYKHVVVHLQAAEPRPFVNVRKRGTMSTGDISPFCLADSTYYVKDEPGGLFWIFTNISDKNYYHVMFYVIYMTPFFKVCHLNK